MLPGANGARPEWTLAAGSSPLHSFSLLVPFLQRDPDPPDLIALLAHVLGFRQAARDVQAQPQQNEAADTRQPN
jgi:hypothetical protein